MLLWHIFNSLPSVRPSINQYQPFIAIYNKYEGCLLIPTSIFWHFVCNLLICLSPICSSAFNFFSFSTDWRSIYLYLACVVIVVKYLLVSTCFCFFFFLHVFLHVSPQALHDIEWYLSSPPIYRVFNFFLDQNSLLNSNYRTY